MSWQNTKDRCELGTVAMLGECPSATWATKGDIKRAPGGMRLCTLEEVCPGGPMTTWPPYNNPTIQPTPAVCDGTTFYDNVRQESVNTCLTGATGEPGDTDCSQWGMGPQPCYLSVRLGAAKTALQRPDGKRDFTQIGWTTNHLDIRCNSYVDKYGLEPSDSESPGNTDFNAIADEGKQHYTCCEDV